MHGWQSQTCPGWFLAKAAVHSSVYLALPAHLFPAPPLPIPKCTDTDPVTSAAWSLIFHHQIRTEGSESAPKRLTSLLLLVCSQKASKSHLAACQTADRKPPVSPLVPAGRVYPAHSTKLPVKKQLNKVPRSMWVSDALHFSLHQLMLAAQQTLLGLSESFPPSPVSALTDDCSL